MDKKRYRLTKKQWNDLILGVARITILYNAGKAEDEGKNYERKRILKMIKLKQKAYIKSGMVTGSCGLSWLIDKLSEPA